MTQNMKQKVFALLTKLGDRDTYSMAANELDTIARTLDPSTNLHGFISSILSTGSSDKPAVRKHCIHLLSVLSFSLPPNSLAPFLTKILSHLSRRLRDSDSSIRSSCIATVSALSSRTTKPAFSSAFLKPLSDTLFTEQETNAQIGAALCLAAAIDAATDPDPGRLRRVLLPRVEKLLKCDSFKAKAAGLVVIGSVIGSGGTAGREKELAGFLVGFLSNEDWAARKAAAETLGRLAVVERDALAECKTECLKAFESRRYDKVKAVREVMNQMMEAWKNVPDVSDEASPPPRSQTSSKADESDGRFSTGSKIASNSGFHASATRKRTTSANRSTPPGSSLATTARKTNLKSSDKKRSAVYRKLDCKKPLDWEKEVSVPIASSVIGSHEDDPKDKNHNVVQRRSNENMKLEVKRNLFGKNSDEKTQKIGGSRSGSRVAPEVEETLQSNVTQNQISIHKDCEELSLIRNQLVQIEKQQSGLVDLLQKFIGSSQNGMRALETRVHGLELTLDEISQDLCLSRGMMSNTTSRRTSCCLLRGADFFSSKFWRKPGRYSISRLSASTNTPSSYAPRCRDDRNPIAETFNIENPWPRLRGGGGIIVNPLAEIHSNPRRT